MKYLLMSTVLAAMLVFSTAARSNTEIVTIIMPDGTVVTCTSVRIGISTTIYCNH